VEPQACLLIADDEERNRALIRVMLRGEPYRTIEGGGGAMFRVRLGTKAA
jgi:CheY-like chemotaxis protein